MSENKSCKEAFRSLKLNMINIPGWRTQRKIIVFESDDWGSIRMPSKEVFETLLNKGIPVDRSHYYKFDCLESEEDYQELFNVLIAYRDRSGNYPIFTNNYVSTNPDFEKIKAGGYKEYIYETISKTYNRSPNQRGNLEIIKQGIKCGIILPQSHSREHLNVMHWMSALQQRDKTALLAFENGVFTYPFQNGHRVVNTYVDSLYYKNDSEKNMAFAIIKDGLRLFERQWGFGSKSFIAPGYIWDSFTEEILHKNGVRYLQGVVVQLQPSGKKGKRFRKKYHFTGQRNKHKQVYLVRNAFFEPSEIPNRDWIGYCLRDISNAFFFNKPAIVQSHRVNYTGTIVKSNRDNNLKLLKTLLKEIVRKWPEVEFLSSVQLGELIEEIKD